MGRHSWICLGLLFGLAAVAAAGDIQVLCPPGISVYLDDQPVGTSNAKEDGLFLMDVEKGKHTIRVEKQGFLPRSYRVRVIDLPIEVKVEPLLEAPTPVPSQQEPGPPESSPPEEAGTTETVGSLIVSSAPQICTVEIDGTVHEKSVPQLSLGGLSVGEHRISFSKPGYEPVTGTVTVQPAAAVAVRGNLVDGKVEMVHEGKGSFRLITRPTNCIVFFLGKRWEKNDLRLNISYVPAGEHRLVVRWNGLERSATVLISRAQRTIVDISFLQRDEPPTITYEPE